MNNEPAYDPLMELETIRKATQKQTIQAIDLEREKIKTEIKMGQGSPEELSAKDEILETQKERIISNERFPENPFKGKS